MTQDLTAALEPGSASEISATATNVIFMVPDGLGDVAAEAYRWSERDWDRTFSGT